MLLRILLLITTMLLFFSYISCENANPEINNNESTIMDANGNRYRTVRIGDQVWMAENLRATKYNDGSAIPQLEDSAAWRLSNEPGYCYYNNTQNPDSIIRFGALYNWYVVGSGKLAPDGWHVPTAADWNILETYMISNGYNYDGSTTGNKIGKALSAKTEWDTNQYIGAIGNDLSANNASGFSALPAGSRVYTGSFMLMGERCHWWSFTKTTDPDYAYGRELNVGYEFFDSNHYNKSFGFSVRLLKD